MSSEGLQQNFIWFVQNKCKEVAKDFNKRLCCEKCRFSTKDIELFERHVANHEEVTFTCTLCNHVSYSRVESQRHSVTHKGAFPYRCNWCPYGAVRRDYMVKHIQRIHGKPASGSFTTNFALPTAKGEHLAQQQTADLCPATSRTLTEPVQNVNLSHTAGNVFSVLPSASQPRTTAPYLVVGPVEQTTSNQTHVISNTTAQSVTSATCILPVTKAVGTPYSVASTSHTMSKAQTHGIINPPNFAKNEVLFRLGGKISAGIAPTLSAIPRVHVSVPADRTSQQKVGPTAEKTVIQSKTATNNQVICLSADHSVPQNTFVQSQAGPTAEKTVIQSNTFANSQVICLSANHGIQQKPMFQSQVGATMEKIILQSKAAPNNVIDLEAGNNTHLKTLLNNPVALLGQRDLEARNVPANLLAQRTANSGVARNIPVAHAVQRSAPTGPYPSSPVERFGQGAPSFTNRRKTRPNILVKTHPNVLVKPPEKLPPSTQSNMQVEMLSTLNQPIQHNKPLTVSCPEEITIPAGCLVELVEVKNGAGGRELELRVVPQQPSGPQLGGSKCTTVDSSRLSFKCKVATDDRQQRSSSQTNILPEPRFKGVHRKEPSTVTVDLNVKDEPDVIEQVTCSKITVTPTPGPLSGRFHGVSRSVASESHKVTQQPSTGHKNTAKATDLVTQVQPVHIRGHTMPKSAGNKNAAVKDLGCNPNSLQTSKRNKHGNVEPNGQGFPVISSVFSLCPSPNAAPTGIRTKVGVLGEPAVGVQASRDSGSKGSVENFNNSVVCRKDLKTEEDTRLLTDNIQKPGQKLKKRKECVLEDTKVPAKFDNDNKSFQPSLNVLKSTTIPEVCGPSADALRTAAFPDQLKGEKLLSESIFSTPSSSLLENSFPEQREGQLTLAMNPTVALPRIPSLDFYSLLESAKIVPEKAVSEESITARPVLCCTSNQQNMQGRAIKLILKRKRSETENKDLGQDQHPFLASFHIQPSSKKRKKEKKRKKKHKSSKATLKRHEVLVNGKVRKLWLTPLKEDQLVKGPAPNQPVVVLNHPNPLFQVDNVSVQDYGWVACSPSPHTQPETTPDKLVNQCPSLKMKLKKVEGQTYQVTELVLKGVSERTIA
ncbi:uncharacterized protein LOC103022214 [Astyanax mexicanus]|uniref:uncharacterized protein LOC103022214 n=1 Tax=Astyanax mexicanus TaxID=7994 RepID=UPI0020CAA4A0|nr:uncharacterized protein LOC103022214 [Astyanax mexicanus]XP_049323714.1 uncharacterized protein LOC103022214 [Astyanax mexicanus]